MMMVPLWLLLWRNRFDFLSEFSLIESCFVSKAKTMHAGTNVANGDDASVHALEPNQELVVSTDTAVAGVHWPHDFPLEKAADRAVCAALSDLAAMGAEACWAWVSVVAENKHALTLMGQGVADALNRYDVELSGGDTVHAPLNSLNITVAGVLEKNTSMQRKQAKTGEKVWFLGQAGFAALGLEQWLNDQKNGSFVKYFSEITPKLQQGKALRALGVRCCMDVSDGILQDAGHICEASNISMRLELSKFPNWLSLCEQIGEEKATQIVLSGGEDYGLLFTAEPDMHGLDAFAECIGECVEGRDVSTSVEVYCEGEKVNIAAPGYNHFAV